MVADYADSVKRAAIEALTEEDVMISVEQVYHAVWGASRDVMTSESRGT